MPTFAQGSRSSLSYIPEVTFGVTPAGNFQNLPFSTHSLNPSKQIVEGTDIQPDRMPRTNRHGNSQVGGDITASLRDGDYDDFLASVMLSSWDTSPSGAPDELKVGITPKYFSIEDYAADVDQVRLFTGCTVSSMSIEIAAGETTPISTTFSMVGQGVSISQTQKTQNDASGAQPFDSYSGDLSLGNVGNLNESPCITNFSFSVDNEFSPTFCIGDVEPVAFQYGRANISGSFSAYFESAPLLNRFINEVESAIEVSVNDPTGANEYTFLFPRIKINSADVGVSGPESRMVECTFVALYDSTEGSSLVIKRPETA